MDLHKGYYHWYLLENFLTLKGASY